MPKLHDPAWGSYAGHFLGFDVYVSLEEKHGWLRDKGGEVSAYELDRFKDRLMLAAGGGMTYTIMVEGVDQRERALIMALATLQLKSI